MKKIVCIVALTVVLLSIGLPRLSAQNDGLYVENATGYKKMLPYPEIREADVMWKKVIIREIDFRQKMNQAFYYPLESQENWKSLSTVIMDAFKEGTISPYKVEMYSDEMKQPLMYSDFESLEMSPHPARDVTGIMRLRLKEVWYFDKHRSQLMVRILAICPVLINEKGNAEALFWVPYNDIREVFSQNYCFNRHNSAAKRTYDEIFLLRMFDSYIIKEENVYDRKIADYAQGLDLMLESDRIKQSIIDYEQSLWEY